MKTLLDLVPDLSDMRLVARQISDKKDFPYRPRRYAVTFEVVASNDEEFIPIDLETSTCVGFSVFGNPGELIASKISFFMDEAPDPHALYRFVR